MAAGSNILSISLPSAMAKKVDRFARLTHQNRSELVRRALRDYLSDDEEDTRRFMAAYKKTRGEKLVTHEELKRKLGLA